MNRRRSIVVATALSSVAPLSCMNTSNVAGDRGPRSNAAEHAPSHAPTVVTSTAYPAAREDAIADDYFGTSVRDPYRWLEDPDSAETRAWVDAQNALSRRFIDAVPEREAIERRLSEIWNYERYGLPEKEAGRYFFARNDGLQNQAVWYVSDALEAAPRVLVDPNTLSKDGTLAVNGTAPSPDGKLFAYACSEAGSDWETLRVRSIEDSRDLDDRVEWVKFSGIAWSGDSRGFYYSTFPMHDTSGNVKLERQELRYHEVGTPQSADRLVYARPDEPEWGLVAMVTDDREMLVMTVSKGTDPRTQVFVQDLRQPGQPVIELVTGFDAEYDPLEKLGRKLYVRTDLDAPTKRVVEIDLDRPERANWREVVPVRERRTLEAARIVGGKLLCAYLDDAHSTLELVDLASGRAEPLKLPELGSVSLLAGGPRDREAFYAFSSFVRPGQVERLDLDTGKLSTWRAPKVAFDPKAFVTELIFTKSKDGTSLPLYVTHRRDVTPSANTPCLLYGYGGFDVSIKPDFSPAVLGWLDQGALYASAVLRGGGEYGREWHAAGTLERKQNVFDDFIACAEELIARKWTSSPKLAIHGRSNGGLLVGACMTQRPELFGAALPGVGVLDMLRYHKFTIGWAWESDYGIAEKSPEAFRYLSAYSPLHNVKPGTCYPPTLVTTADHDDRVVPAHSYKFTTALQAAQACSNPILIRIDVRAGHGAGKPTAKKIEETADEWAFLWRALGMSHTAARD